MTYDQMDGEPPPQDSYRVVFGEDLQGFDARTEAIVAAKELSTNRRGRVRIFGPANREAFEYRAGRLEAYVFATRRGETARLRR